MPRPTPDSVQQTARKALDASPVYTREDGTPVDIGEVPQNAQGRLVGARRSFLNRLATTPEFPDLENPLGS